VKAIVVISLDLDSPDDLTGVLEHIDPPRIPHFGNEVRVAIDGFNNEAVASQVLDFLDAS
jgi:hypothetical protein